LERKGLHPVRTWEWCLISRIIKITISLIIFQVFLHGEGIHSTAVQLEYQSEADNSLADSPCRLRCPKIQKGEQGGRNVWVDCDTGKCCAEEKSPKKERER
jgi:hypothetical protein